jgi:GNAT superfamily N-acetyltransferase
MDGLNEAARRLVPSRNVPAVLDAELGHLYTVVCERDGECVGVGALDGTEIRRVYVDPSAQGSGVGEALMGDLEAAARRAGADEVHLEASPSSVSFYEGRGYVSSPEERLIVGDAEFRFVPMRRALTTPGA